MKSFRQYLQEVVTDAPKKHREHEYSTEHFPKKPTNRHPSTYYDYKYKSGTHVAILTSHKDTGDSSNLRFLNTQGLESRTGESDAKGAREILKDTIHGGSHHLRKHKPKYFDYDVKNDDVATHDDNPEKDSKSKNARKNIYHKIMSRLADKHGYELHNTKTYANGETDNVTYKRIDQK